MSQHNDVHISLYKSFTTGVQGCETQLASWQACGESKHVVDSKHILGKETRCEHGERAEEYGRELTESEVNESSLPVDCRHEHNEIERAISTVQTQQQLLGAVLHV